jgi:hypothetical protein
VQKAVLNRVQKKLELADKQATTPAPAAPNVAELMQAMSDKNKKPEKVAIFVILHPC